LRSYLGRLAINLEAQVVNAPVESQESSSHELIYSGSVQESEDPLIVVQGPNESQDIPGDGHILVVWKLSAFLVRPRLRLQNPSIVFSATANLKPVDQVQSEILKDEYLPSQVPSGMNLLESFGGDPSLGGVKPRLSALRVSRVAPSGLVAKEMMRPLRNISRQAIKVYPAINARVRYSRPNTSPTNPTIIASLDIDITPYANCEMVVSKVELSLPGGKVEDLNTASGMKLPIKSLPQDDLTFLYRVTPDDPDAPNKSLVRSLGISIAATANVSSVCKPQISMSWTTSVDFSPPVNAGFGLPAQPIHRLNRPSQLSIDSSTFETVPTVSPLAITRPDALPAIEVATRHQRNPSVPDFGVTITFMGPSGERPIYPGIPFSWSVFIVNQSDRPRKLVLTVLPKRRRTDARITRPPSTGHAGPRKDHKIADAVMDEKIVYAMQHNSALEPTDIVCMSSDTRVGPLAPSSCYEVELKFMALKVGILSLEAVRVVDLATQEHVDVKDLPTIVVSAPPKA
jgi:hypothetical protein